MVTPVSTPSSSNIWNRASDYGQGEIKRKSPQITPILLSQWPNPQNSFVGRNKSFPPPEHKANIKFVPTMEHILKLGVISKLQHDHE